MLSILRSIWSYRFFIITSIKSDFKNKFARSKLGAFWLILNPLALVLMYVLVLSPAMSSKIKSSNQEANYLSYLLGGMLCWSLLSDIILKTSTVFVENANTIKKLVFPKIALPLIVVGISLINNLVLAIFVLASLVWTQNLPLQFLFFYPPLALITVMLGVGLGLILGILNVFIRDIGQMVPIVLQFSFWFTPIAYPVEILPPRFKALLQLNPFYYLTSSYQNVFSFRILPDLEKVIASLVISSLICLIAYYLYKQSSVEVVDSL